MCSLCRLKLVLFLTVWMVLGEADRTVLATYSSSWCSSVRWSLWIRKTWWDDTREVVADSVL